jgi:hypothetical protein
MTCNAAQVTSSLLVIPSEVEESLKRNDEARMSNVELMTNNEPVTEAFGFSHSLVIRHSNFVIRLMPSRGGES